MGGVFAGLLLLLVLGVFSVSSSDEDEFPEFLMVSSSEIDSVLTPGVWFGETLGVSASVEALGVSASGLGEQSQSPSRHWCSLQQSHSSLVLKHLRQHFPQSGLLQFLQHSQLGLLHLGQHRHWPELFFCPHP